MPTIMHFEVPAEDIERAKQFYEQLFDWKITRIPGYEDYLGIATTDESGAEGLGGGLMRRQNPQHTTMNYIGVASVNEYMQKVEKLGGKVVMGKHPVPGMGYFAVCLDTENNAFGIWETDPEAK